MLKKLSHTKRLVLLTEGDFVVQHAKIKHLGIEPLFSDILVVDPKRGDSKLDAIERFIRHAGISPEDLVVIGNRLDNEIAAARSLGTKSIWVRAGEGSEMAETRGSADAIVRHVTEVPDVLQRWGDQGIFRF
jgi:FMN phosphatase YigB (HAD superfamily)